jgi:ClpP class serine protease
MHFNTLSAILRGSWLIQRSFVQTHLPLIHGIITGKSNGAELFKGAAEFEQPFAYANGTRIEAYRFVWDESIGNYKQVFNEDLFPDNSLFVIPNIGPVTKYNGDCGEPGNVRRQGWASDFANSNKLSGLISYIDSPGGQADGTPQYADFIKSIDKPKIALVDGGAYSAGAWNASAHDAIYLSSDFAGFGSIGAYTTIVDFAGYFKKMGIKVQEIYPDESSEKNLEYREALKGNTDLMKADVAELAKYFISSFADNRAGKLKNDSWEKGKSFSGKEAIDIGMVDGAANFEDVARMLGAEVKTPGKKIISTPAKKSTSHSTNMKYPKLTALLTALEGGAAATQEELAAVNAEFAEGGIKTVGLFPSGFATAAADLATANTSLETANASLVAANGNVTKLTTELGAVKESVISLTTENTGLKAKIAAAPAVGAPVVATTDPVTEKTQSQLAQERINALPHNQGLLDNPLFQKSKP